jgi:hypothetical protein
MLLIHGILERASAGDALGHPGRDSGGLELGTRSPEDGLRGSEDLDQQSQLTRAQPGNHAQREPVQLLL